LAGGEPAIVQIGTATHAGITTSLAAGDFLFLFRLSGNGRWLSARPNQNALGSQEFINRRFWSVPLNTDMATRSLSKLSFPLVCKRTENPESGVPALIAGHSDGEINIAVGARCALGSAAE
jgi:hypothetical protein